MIFPRRWQDRVVAYHEGDLPRADRPFSAAELARAFPDRQPGQRERLLRDLGAMRLIEAL